MSKPIVQLRRKNEGAQFTVADADTRQILHWYRPGETLPFYVWYENRDYEVTKEDIAQAALKGRVVLKPLDESFHGPDAIYAENRKGIQIGFRKPTLWQRLKAWAVKQINKVKGVFK